MFPSLLIKIKVVVKAVLRFLKAFLALGLQPNFSLNVNGATILGIFF